MKKIIWGLGMSIATIAPAVAVVSCGQKHKEVVNNIGVEQPKVEMQGAGQTKLDTVVDKVQKFIAATPSAKLINININLLSTLGVTEWHFQKNNSGLWVNSERLMIRDLYNQFKINVTNVSDVELEKFFKRFEDQKTVITATDEEKDNAWESGIGDVIGGSSAQDKLDTKDIEWLKTLTENDIAKFIVEAGGTANPIDIKTVQTNIGLILGYAPATLDTVDQGATIPGTTFRQELVEMVTKDAKSQMDTVKLLAHKGTDLVNSNPFTDSDFVEIYDQDFNGVDGYKTMTPLIKFKINE